MRRDAHLVLGQEEPPKEKTTLFAMCGRELRNAGFIWDPEPISKITDLNREKTCKRCLAKIETSVEFRTARYVAGALDGELLLPMREREAAD